MGTRTELKRTNLTTIVDILNRGELVRAIEIAGAIGVCERSVYRYMSQLKAAGHPFISEAGAGYLVRQPPQQHAEGPHV